MPSLGIDAIRWRYAKIIYNYGIDIITRRREIRL
jgi:hypothetical protein